MYNPKNQRVIGVFVRVLVVLMIIVEYFYQIEDVHLLGLESNIYLRAFIFFCISMYMLVKLNPMREVELSSVVWGIFAGIPFLISVICMSLM